MVRLGLVMKDWRTVVITCQFSTSVERKDRQVID